MIDLTIFFRQKLKRDLNSSLKRLMLRKRKEYVSKEEKAQSECRRT